MEIDGQFVNAATIVVGIFSIFVRPLRRWCNDHPKCWAVDKTVVDFLSGTSLLPFAVLGATPLFPALGTLIGSMQFPMALAGVIGSFFVLGEILTAGRDEASAPQRQTN